jgi:hypothetical protein
MKGCDSRRSHLGGEGTSSRDQFKVKREHKHMQARSTKRSHKKVLRHMEFFVQSLRSCM